MYVYTFEEDTYVLLVALILMGTALTEEFTLHNRTQFGMKSTEVATRKPTSSIIAKQKRFFIVC